MKETEKQKNKKENWQSQKLFLKINKFDKLLTRLRKEITQITHNHNRN